MVAPLVVNKRNGLYTIVGGHQRYNILKELGYKEIPCILVDLDEIDEIELNLSLNKNTGYWDNEKLKEIFTNIDFDEEEKYITGFSDEEIENLKTDFIEDLVNEDFSDVGVNPLNKFSMTFTIDKVYEEKFLAYVKLFGKDKLIELMTAEVIKEVD
jgi:ParB-like chromosome segregation protein Spo0J